MARKLPFFIEVTRWATKEIRISFDMSENERDKVEEIVTSLYESGVVDELERKQGVLDIGFCPNDELYGWNSYELTLASARKIVKFFREKMIEGDIECSEIVEKEIKY